MRKVQSRLWSWLFEDMGRLNNISGKEAVKAFKGAGWRPIGSEFRIQNLEFRTAGTNTRETQGFLLKLSALTDMLQEE